jgi:O-antigen/teichoic acid export membrane protein
MADLRRALLFASGGRYLVMGMSLASAAVLAHLLTPADFGISVLGTSLLAVAEAIRELGSTAYLVQQKDLTKQKIRTVFTVSLIVTLVMSAMLVMFSSALARFYELPGLARYVQIIALSYVIAPFSHPIYSVLSRDMEFGKLAFLDTSAMLINAATSIVFVALGFSYLGIAWATVASAVSWTLLGLIVKRDYSVYRPSLTEWRSVLAFGAYGSATAVLYRSSESLFWLILGKMLDARAVGLCQRSLSLAQFPDRVVLAGIGAVALPAFSDHARQGRALDKAYLTALGHMTAIQWPALTLLAIMAEPIILLLYGSQWREAVPLTQIFALALLLNFPTSLNYPIQVAVGAIRHTVPLALVQTTVSLIVLTVAANHGIRAVALSSFITIPFNVGLSVLVVRAHVPFLWGEFAGAVAKSAVVTGSCALGPLAVMASRGRIDVAALPILMATGLGGVGWLAGLWLTRHPLFHEILNFLRGVGKIMGTGMGFLSRSLGSM